MEQSKFTHINRVIDPKTRIHYLEEIDERDMKLAVGEEVELVLVGGVMVYACYK